MFIVVVGSYEGNDDVSVDKTNADTVLAALFPNRWKEDCTLNVSAKTVTASGGACDAKIIPFLYLDDVLVDEDLYTFTPGTGVFLFDATPASGTYTATFVRNIYGANIFTPDTAHPNTMKDVKAFGTIDPVYSTLEYQNTTHAVTVSGTFDVANARRKYAASDLEKSFYGDQWDEDSDAENEPKRNTDPFFVAGIWWYPDAEAGQLEIKKLVYYKCTLNKPIIPIPAGTDDPAGFTASAVSMYNRSVNTLAS
jgi:hypothetical protein